MTKIGLAGSAIVENLKSKGYTKQLKDEYKIEYIGSKKTGGYIII